MSAADRRGRRSGAVLLAIGAAALAAALIGLVAGLAGIAEDSGDGEDARAGKKRAPADARPLGLSTIVEVPLGIRAGLPAGWRALRGGGPLRLAGPDGRVGVSVAVAGPASLGAAEAQRRVERAVRRGYEAVRALRAGATRVGGLPARAVAFAARTPSGSPVEILAATVASRWRTYAVLSFGEPGAAAERLADARAVLDSLRFRRPKQRR